MREQATNNKGTDNLVGTQTGETAVWKSVRRGGKFLFEYNPVHNQVRLKLRGNVWVVDLEAIQEDESVMETAVCSEG